MFICVVKNLRNKNKKKKTKPKKNGKHSWKVHTWGKQKNEASFGVCVWVFELMKQITAAEILFTGSDGVS